MAVELAPRWDEAEKSANSAQYEEVLELAVEQDLRRDVVNGEFMLLHGNVPAQLHRRGPRQHLPGSASSQRKPALLTAELRRPQTAYTQHVTGILATQFDAKRPKTSEGKMQSIEFRQRKQLRPSSVGSNELAKPRAPLLVVPEAEFAEPPPLEKTPAGGMRRPGRYKGSARRIASSKASSAHLPNQDKQHVEDLQRLLRAELDFLPPDRPTCVHVLLAGTKQDFLAERAALHEHVWPELREMCENLGLELHVQDIGSVRGHVPNLRHHLQQLSTASSRSMGPFYVHFGGNYCPPPCAPPEMPVLEYEAVRKMTADLKTENQHFMDVFYKKEENMLPPKYIFQHDAIAASEKDYHGFLNLWQNLVCIAEGATKFNAEQRMQYETKSANEHEMNHLFHGLKANAARLVGMKCLSFYRNFKDIKGGSSQDIEEADFFNVSGAEPSYSFEYNTEEKAAKVQEILRKCLPAENVSNYEISWAENGIDVENNEEHQKYMTSFVEDFKSTIKTLISRSHAQWIIRHKNGRMYTELLEQGKVFMHNSRSFGGREQYQETVRAYLKNADLCKKPFVVYGPSGAGKTALLSFIARLSKDLIGKSCACVMRSLGITQASSDITQVLVSICIQICAIYNMDAPPPSDYNSVNKMANHLRNTLDLVAKHHASRRPLLLIMDGLDKLRASDRADTLFWLPHILPRHVYLITSVNNEALVERLHKRLGADSMLQIGDFDPNELGSVFDTILRHRNRAVSAEQKEVLIKAAQENPEPLFVKTLALEASQWSSMQPVDTLSLPTNINEALTALSYRLEEKFGIKFVQKAMAYLCLLSAGISERELYDLLCSDQEIVQYYLKQNKLDSASAHKVYELIHERVLQFVNSLKGYLVRVGEYDRHLLQWSCEQYKEILGKKYFGATNPFTGKNDNLEDSVKKMLHLYSVEKPFTLKVKLSQNAMQTIFELQSETMPYKAGPQNSRALNVLPSLITLTGSEQDHSKQLKDTCLCNFTWLFSNLHCVSVRTVEAYFNQITEKDHEVDALRLFLRTADRNLSLDCDSLAAQLMGCMPALDEDYPLLQQMLVDAQSWVDASSTPLLVPVFPFFPSALDICRCRLWNLVDIMQIDASQRLAVMRTESGYIEIWDLQNYELVHALGVRYDRVTPNVFCNATHVLGINGGDVNVWEIESGLTENSVDLEKLTGEVITSMYIFCHTANFDIVAVHASDEDFNQSITFIYIPTGEILSKLAKFDVKDDFFKSSALFNESGDRMVFAMSRSTVVDDKKNSDIVKLQIFNMEEMSLEHTIECGEKKFNKLLLKDNNLAILSWSDCSFDVYDIFSGQHKYLLAAPDSRLAIEHCILTRDNYLVGLSSSLSDVARRYYALWFWNVEEQTNANLLSSTFQDTQEIPKHFVIVEELHIAVLSFPDIATIAIWDLPNSECIYQTQAHIGTVDNVFKTGDPYQIFTCSGSEEVIKLWDLHDVIRQAKEDKVHKTRHRIRTDTSSFVSNATAKSILNRDAAANTSNKPEKKTKKELRKSKSVRFADDESLFSEEVKSVKSDVGFQNGVEEARAELAAVVGGGAISRDEDVIATQLESSKGATCAHFSKDGSLLILSTNKCLPTIWEMSNYHVIKRLEPLHDSDLCTPWAELVCNDASVVGLTLDEHSKDVQPLLYKYNVWDVSSGEPLHRDAEQPTNVSTCKVNLERDKVVLCCLDAHTPGDLSQIRFTILDIAQNQCLQEACYNSTAVPTSLQLMDDISFAVANHIVKPGEHSQGFTVYHLEVEDSKALLDPEPYDYRKGTKHKLYRATQNVILPGGQISVSTGLNGDLQVWDITSREYEGNLFCEPGVKDTRNPSLHNHNSKRILDMVVSLDGAYLVCAGANGSTSVWDMENEVNIFSYHGHASEVLKVAISDDNQLVITAGGDEMIYVWSISQVERPLCRLHVHSTVTSLRLSSDNKSLAVLSQRRNEPSRFMLFQLRNLPEPSTTEK